MQLDSTDLYDIILEEVPELHYAEPEAKMRLRLMTMGNYEHVGYYDQDPSDDAVTLSNLNGELPNFQIDNMVSSIYSQNSAYPALGYYFITKGEKKGTYCYSHYHIEK